MPYSTFIDTAEDYDTAYSTFGSQKLGVPGMLPESLSGLGALPPYEDALSAKGIRYVNEELAADKGFSKVLEAAFQTANPEAYLAREARKAMANEVDPSSFPETAPYWKAMRKKLRAALRAVPEMIRQSIGKLTFGQKVKLLKALSQGGEIRAQVAGYDDDLIGMGFYDLIGSVVGAAAGVYGSKLQGDVSKDIAKIQASTAIKSAEVQKSIAEAQAAIAAAQARQAEQEAAREVAVTERAKVTGVVTQEVAGVPLWGWVLGLGALAAGIYFFVFKR